MSKLKETLTYLKKNISNRYLNHIPGNLGFPFVGDTFNFLSKPTGTFERKQAKYGAVFKMRLFGETVVFLTGAEANRFVLIDQAKYFSSKEGWDFAIGELFHEGLMLKDGEDHKHHRSILQSAFKKEPLSGYLTLIEPMTDNYLQGWQNQSEVLVFPAMKALTLQLAGKLFFGLDFSADLQKINQAIVQVVKASTTALPFHIPFTTYWYGIKGRKVLEKYFYQIIQQKRANPSKDILGILCTAQNEEGETLTDLEIIDHLIFLLMAGHDTTASTLTSLFYELAQNPEWQERLRKESIRFAENNPISYNSLNQLEELAWAIKETLRMHPPLILIPRKTTKELQFEGFTLPAQTGVSVLIYYNHYQKSYWQNPEIFDPLRFSDEKAEHKKCPHAYAPFGAGQHYCLGFGFAEMQIKTIMHKVLTTYRWSVSPSYRTKYKNIPIQEPKDGLPVKIEKIDAKKAVEIRNE